MWLLVLCLALFYVSARLYTFYTTLRRNDVPGQLVSSRLPSVCS